MKLLIISGLLSSKAGDFKCKKQPNISIGEYIFIWHPNLVIKKSDLLQEFTQQYANGVHYTIFCCPEDKEKTMSMLIRATISQFEHGNGCETDFENRANELLRQENFISETAGMWASSHHSFKITPP